MHASVLSVSAWHIKCASSPALQFNLPRSADARVNSIASRAHQQTHLIEGHIDASDVQRFGTGKELDGVAVIRGSRQLPRVQRRKQGVRHLRSNSYDRCAP
jgi:hypothetical protein